MKKLMRGAFFVGTMFCIATSLYAKAPSANKIFPSYTGITATVVTQDVNMRAFPERAATVTDAVNGGEVYVIGKNEDWYRVKCDGQEGWIYKDYINISEPDDVPYSKVIGEEIVAYGKQFIGTPYVWGGNDLRRGVDCSGLTKEVFEIFDIDISRVSYMQVKDGQQVKKDELKPGDLVFFDTTGINNGKVTHVGIYAGNDKFLHADSTHGVMLSSLNSPYYTRNYVTSSRIIGA